MKSEVSTNRQMIQNTSDKYNVPIFLATLMSICYIL